MIPKETPVGSRVRVYRSFQDESTAWIGHTTSVVKDGKVCVSSAGTPANVEIAVRNVEPIGARPFVSHAVQCPNCQHEFNR